METSLTYVCIQDLEDNGYVMEADRLTQRTEADLIQERDCLFSTRLPACLSRYVTCDEIGWMCSRLRMRAIAVEWKTMPATWPDARLGSRLIA